MGRTEIALRQYKQHYDEFYSIVYEEQLKGQTTRHEAMMIAENKAAMLSFRIMCQTNLWFLGTEVYGMADAKKGGRKLLYEPAHGPLCDELSKDESSLIWMSRHMLKTTWGEIWCVQKILRDPANTSILLGSMSANRARSILRTIKGMILHPKIKEAFSDIIVTNDRRWAKNDLDAMTMTRDIPDPDGVTRQIPPDGEQIEVFGLDKVVIGKHPTDIYLDDIITDKNTTTAVQIEKAIDQFSAISSLKGIDTVMKIIGTPWHSMDLYHYLIQNKVIPESNQIRIAGAHIEGDKEIIDYPWYTRKFLDQQKKEMRHLYWPQIHLDTRPREDRMFVPPYPIWSNETFPKNPLFYIGCDPATGLGNDKAGIAIGAVDIDNPTGIFLVEADSHKLLSEELAQVLVEKCMQYRPKRMGIEYGLQVALDPLIRLKAQEKQREIGYFPMPEPWEVKTGGGSEYGQKKWQKIDNTFGSMLRDGRIFLHPSMVNLEFQMGTFDKNKQKNEDDILDAVMILIRTVPYFSYGFFKDNGEPVARKLTWKSLFGYNKEKSERERIFAN